MRGRRLFLVLFCFLSAVPSFAAYGKKLIGTAGAQFLKLPVNARAIGMGEAYGSVADGADALFWNPAGLERVRARAFHFTHALYLADTSYDFAAFATRLGKLGTIGVGFQYLGSKAIDRVDETNTTVGTFSPYDLAIHLGWALRLKELGGDQEFTLGVSGKYIRSQIIEQATAGAVDLGLGWEPLTDWQIAAAVQNAGSSMRFVNEADDLPLNLKLGTSYTLFRSWLISSDINFPKDNDPNLALGTEYRLKLDENFEAAARLGFNSRAAASLRELSSLGAGAGLAWKGYGLDFAWVPFGEIGQTYRLSISAKF